MTFAAPADSQYVLQFSCAVVRKLSQSNLRLSVCVLLLCSKVETDSRTNRGVWCMILSSREMVKDEEVRLVAKETNALLSVKFGTVRN